MINTSTEYFNLLQLQVEISDAVRECSMLDFCTRVRESPTVRELAFGLHKLRTQHAWSCKLRSHAHALFLSCYEINFCKFNSGASDTDLAKTSTDTAMKNETPHHSNVSDHSPRERDRERERVPLT